MSFDKTKYNNEFAKKNYDRIILQVRKGKKEKLKTHVADFGYKSLNDFILQAIDDRIARDLEGF